MPAASQTSAGVVLRAFAVAAFPLSVSAGRRISLQQLPGGNGSRVREITRVRPEEVREGVERRVERGRQHVLRRPKQ